MPDGLSSTGQALNPHRLPLPSFEEFERDYLSVRAANCLRRNGIASLRELCSLTRNDLLHIKNMGIGTLDFIEASLAHFGLALDSLVESKEKRRVVEEKQGESSGPEKTPPILFQIYGLCDPSTPSKVEYVGKTEKKLSVRLTQHLCAPSSSRLADWIRSLSAPPAIVPLEVVYRSVPLGQVDPGVKLGLALERKWITRCHALNPSLLNTYGTGKRGERFMLVVGAVQQDPCIKMKALAAKSGVTRERVKQILLAAGLYRDWLDGRRKRRIESQIEAARASAFASRPWAILSAACSRRGLSLSLGDKPGVFLLNGLDCRLKGSSFHRGYIRLQSRGSRKTSLLVYPIGADSFLVFPWEKAPTSCTYVSKERTLPGEPGFTRDRRHDYMDFLEAWPKDA